MKRLITLSALVMSTALRAQDISFEHIPNLINQFENQKTKQALLTLNQIEDSLREQKLERSSSREWKEFISVTLSKLITWHSKFQNDDKAGRSPAYVKSLEAAELRDRVETLTLWVIKELGDDSALRLMVHSSQDSDLAWLVYFLSRECEAVQQSCRKDILKQAASVYRTNAKNPDTFILARAGLQEDDFQGMPLSNDKTLLADLTFMSPGRVISSPEKPSIAEGPHGD